LYYIVIPFIASMEIKDIRNKILDTGNVTSCAVMIVEKDGDIAEYVITDPTKTIVTLADLTEIASIIALRYGIVDYNKKLGGLQLTMDVFRDDITVTTGVGEKLLVTVVPNTVKIDMVKVIQDVKKILILELGR
ncbi:MAG: hypothetical protein ACRDFB_07800, partial [Rhabdochlamydiaceae bacterium]